VGHVLLFGRVPADRQIYVSAIAFGSVIWLVVLVGVAFSERGKVPAELRAASGTGRKEVG
jgi:hypothetical protein